MSGTILGLIAISYTRRSSFGSVHREKFGDDEAGTLAQLKTLRRELLDLEIGEYGGCIVKTISYGILIEFPSAADAGTVDFQIAW